MTAFVDESMEQAGHEGIRRLVTPFPEVAVVVEHEVLPIPAS